MATQTTTQIFDDLDESPNATTVSFGYGGKELEIDLSKKNRAALDKALKPYVEAARTVHTKATGRAAATRKSSSADLAAIRTWAAENGINVSGRGRISAAVVAAYNADH